MKSCNRYLTSWIYWAGAILAWPTLALAQYTPNSLNISGGLFLPTGLPVTSTSVDFRLEIWDKNATCKLYEETHTGQNLSQTKGGFSLQLGQGSSVTNFRDGGNPASLSWLVFDNPGAPATVFAGCGGGVVFAQGDNRLIRVYYNLGSGMTAMTPDVPIESSAYAMVANTLQGKSASEFIQVRDDVGTDLNQSNVETVFSATNYAKLLQLLNNTFSGSYGFNNQRITDVAAPTTGTDAVNRTWVDGHVGDKSADLSGVGSGVNNGHSLIWDAAGNRWVTGVPSAVDNSKLPLAGGTMTGPATFLNVFTDHITMSNQTTLMLGRYTNVQEGALGLGVGDEGRMFYNTEMDAVRVWNGAGYIGFGASGAAGGDLTGSYPNPTLNVNVVTNTKIADDAVQSRNIDQAGIGINRLLISDNTTGSTVRFKTCALNQILRWEATGWQCVDVGTALPNSTAAAGVYGSGSFVSQIGINAQGVVTSAANVAIAFPVVSVNGKTGAVILNGADLGLGTASLEDVGNGNNEIPMTDGTGKLNPSVIPTLGIGDISGAITQIVAGSGLVGGGTQGVVTLAVDLTQVDAYKLRGRDLSAAVPNDNDVLMWNALTSTWLSTAIPSAPTYTFTGVNGALVTGPALNKTIGIDTGVTAGQIVQVAAGDRLPVIDGSQLTQISNLRNVNISTTAPTSNQVLQYNGSAWEAATLTDNAGVTYVATTTDLSGGPITSTGTLGVVTGTGANQILRLNGSSQIPAVDGSLLTFVNAASIRGENVATTAPTSNQVLRYNGSAWEPATLVDNAGVTLVAMGSGMVPGDINATGTITIDVGTGPNQIVQLDGTSRLPAVNGSQLTNVNAVQIQSRDIAGGLPADNQVLTWNNSAARWEPRTPGAGADNLGSHIAAQNIQLNGFWLSGDGNNEGIFIPAAGNVGVGTNTPNVNAILDVNGAGALSAMLVPRDTSGNRPTGVDGMIRYNTSNAKMEVYENGNWYDVVQTPDGGIVTLTGVNGALVSGPATVKTIGIDTGVTAGQIVQVAAGDRLPVIDGSQLTQISNLRNVNVSTTAPTSNQVLQYNGSAWEAATLTDNAGVTYVATTTDLTGGPINGTGTLGVNTGTGANQILKLNGSSQIPAVDGSLLTFVNAASIRGVNVSTTAPTSNQVLRYNGSAWEAMTLVDNAGVTLVAMGSGMVPGDISATGTITIDVGTGPNQIVQLDGSSRIPAVNGSLLTNVNAVQLQTYNVHNSAPADNQVLTWNASATRWEARSPGAGADNMGNHTAAQNIQLNGFWLSGDGNNEGIFIPAAGNVGVGTNAPNANAILDVNGAGALSAMLVPRDTSGNRPTGVGGMIRYNTSNAKMEVYENGNWYDVVQALDGVGVSYVATTTDLTGGPISSTGTLGINTGTGANQILKLNGSSQIPAVDGSLLTFVNAASIRGVNVSTTAPTTNQILRYNGSAWEAFTPTDAGIVTLVGENGALVSGPADVKTISIDTGVTAGQIVQVAAGDRLPVIDGSQLTQISNLRNVNVSTTAPTSNQVLQYNGSAWEAATLTDNAGVTYVATTTDLTGGPINGTGTLGVNTGTGANQILKLNGSSQIPAVDGSLLTFVNAASIRGVNVSTTAPTSNQVLRYNGSAWEAMTLVDNAGVTLVAMGSGMVPGDISATGTITIDVGTGPNQIVQLDGSSRIPAVNGSLLTNVNAVQLQTYNVHSAAPGDNQVLTWNATATRWEARSPGAGADHLGNHTAAQNIQLNGYWLSGDGNNEGIFIPAAGNVGVGTNAPNANAILDVNGAGALSAMLVPRDTTANRPTGVNGMIRYNTNTAKMEVFENNGWADVVQAADGVGVSFVATTTDLTGGPISSTGTLGINTGTGANQILKLNGSSQIPAVDGSLLTNINAASIRGVNISTTAPTANQVLRYNGSAWEAYTPTDAGIVILVGNNGALVSGPADVKTISIDTGVTAGQIVQVAAGDRLPVIDGSQLTQISNLRNVNVSTTAPISNQVLRYNGSAWEAMTLVDNAGVTLVAMGSGMVPGDISATGTITIDVGTGPNQIVQLDGSSRIPAVNGSLLTNVNAVQLQTYNVHNSAPADNQVLTWNATATRWEARSPGAGADNLGSHIAAQNVQLNGFWLSGDGNNEGIFIPAAGNVGVGTNSPNANAILDVNGAGALSAMLVPRDTTANRPTGVNGMIRYNTNTSKMEVFENNSWADVVQAADGVGVSFVATTTDLTGGPISSTGTLGINTGTGANQILKLNGSSQIPAVDASLLTFVNAASIRGVNISTTAPTGNQVLQYNGSAWEAASLPAANDVAAGTAILLGGPATMRTISVDVGIGPNQIPQLNGSGFLGIGTATVTTGAVADFYGASNLDSAVVLPRATTGNRPTTGVNGMIRYNTSLAKFEVYENGNWYNMATGTGADNLGNHTATQAIQLNNQWLSNDGGAEGIRIDNSGNVGIGTNNPTGGDLVVYRSGGSATINAFSGPGKAYLSLYSNASSSGSKNKLIYSDAGKLVLGKTDDSWTSDVAQLVIDNSGNVGIGTSSPNTAAVLDVNGTGNLSAMIVPRATTAQRPVTAANGMIRYNTNTSKFEAYAAGNWADVATGSGDNLGNHIATTNIQLGSNWLSGDGGNEGVRVDNNGLVSIGTTAFVDALTVVGSTSDVLQLKNTNNTGATSIDFSDDGGNQQIFFGWGNTGNGSFGDTAFWGTNNAKPIVFMPNSQERMRIDANGRLGIGTATPNTAAVLDVNGTGNLSAMIVPRATQAQRPVTAANGMIRYNTNTSKFEVYAAGNWADVSTGAGGGSWTDAGGNVYRASGRVGIGGAPGTVARLELFGSSSTDSDIYMDGTGVIASQDAQVFHIDSNNDSADQYFSFRKDGYLWSDGTELMRIQENGFVGIGASNPQGVLNVAGTTQTYMDRTDNNNNSEWALTLRHMRADATAPSANFGVALSFDGEGFSNGSSANMALISGAWENNQTNNTTDRDGYIAFSTAQNDIRGERMRITSGGNVGVGTNNPGTKVDVRGSTNDETSAAINIYNGASGNTAAALITPQSDTASGAFGTFSGSYANAALADRVAVRAETNASGITLGAVATAGDIRLFTGGWNERMRVDSVGRIGIGTTTPNTASVLDINGTGNLSAMIVPRATTAERPVTAANGMIRYNTNLSKFEVYQAGNWTSMATETGGSTPAGSDLDIQFNDAGVMGATSDFTYNKTSKYFRVAGDGGFISDVGPNLTVSNSNATVVTDTQLGTIQTGSITDSGSLHNAIEFRASQTHTATAAGNYMAFKTVTNGTETATERMRIDQDGQIGIGTLAPSESLHVVGNLEIEDNNPKFVFDDNNGNDVYLQNVNGDLRFSRNDDATINMLIEQIGRIGIGTSTPNTAAVLDVNGTGNLSAMIVPRATTAQRPVTAANGMIRYNTNTSKFEAYQSGNWTDMIGGSATPGGSNTQIQFNNAGVMAGASNLTWDNANSRLNLSSSGGAATVNLPYVDSSIKGVEQANDAHAGHLSLVAASARSTGSSNKNGGTLYLSGGNSTGTGTSTIEFQTATAGGSGSTVRTPSTKMMINGAGNVGIGTATPIKQLDISGLTGQPGSLGIRSISGEGAKIYFGTNNQYDGTGGNSAGVITFNDNLSGGFEFRTNNASGDPDNVSKDKMVITNVGRVGIATTSPTSGTILDVYGTGVNFSSLLIPRDTTANRPTGVNGMIRYNTNTNRFEGYAHGGWSSFGGGLVAKIKYAGTSNCVWTSSSSGWAAYAADTDCPTATVSGSASAPGTKIPAIVVNNLPPGDYEVVVNTQFYQDPGGNCRWRIHDGTTYNGSAQTNMSGESKPNMIGQFSYTSHQASVTFQVQLLSMGGTATCYLANDEPGNFDFDIYVKRL